MTPSPMNPRKTFDEDAIQELADNIEKQGLLQPITVRPIKYSKQFAVVDGNADFHRQYEIVYGERRYRALCKLSEKWADMDAVAPKGYSYNRFSEVSAIVREMSDEEAFDAMITENLQRKDVDPMEEAFAFGQLAQRGKTTEEIAIRFGKSIRFVNDRIKLNGLIPELMLAIKEDKMSISAGMMIAKLDEEYQRQFFKQYDKSWQGFSKSNAQSFLNDLFMTLDKSLWFSSDNQADEEFEGDCGCKCSECPHNTANHGCLFWEMKGEDSGRCTNRPGFEAKTISYMLKEIDNISDKLVKAGEPLEFGKTVLGIKENYLCDSTEIKDVVAKLKSKIAERGYELVDLEKTFQSRCFYNEDDERTLEMLKDGQLYRCLNLFNWRSPMLQHERWHIKKGDTKTNSGKDGTPFRVKEIIEKIGADETMLKSSFAVAGAEALCKCTPSGEPLDEEEKVMLLCCMLTNNFTLAHKTGMHTSYSTSPENIHRYVVDHPEKWSAIASGWMLQQINGVHANLRIAEPILDKLGKKHCPEDYQEAKNGVQNKFNKAKQKAEKELKTLGYGLDGKILTKAKGKN